MWIVTIFYNRNDYKMYEFDNEYELDAFLQQSHDGAVYVTELIDF
ncbi:hypothetical protein ACFOU2_01345 [Bacillus songklensis]|uniref:Uncharacterized protein n=1 Tax=Bacillus songklensis TaxID=1069116 RepID=A0ABV8AWC9_9BACI